MGLLFTLQQMYDGLNVNDVLLRDDGTGAYIAEWYDPRPQPTQQEIDNYTTAMNTIGSPEFEQAKHDMWVAAREDIRAEARRVYFTLVLQEVDDYHKEYKPDLIDWYKAWRTNPAAPIPDFCQDEWDEDWSHFVNGGFANVDSMILDASLKVIVYPAGSAIDLTKINAMKANTVRWMNNIVRPRINRGLSLLRDWDNYDLQDPLGSYAARIKNRFDLIEPQITEIYNGDYLVNELPARETEFSITRIA